jgi:hypothetical protein
MNDLELRDRALTYAKEVPGLSPSEFMPLAIEIYEFLYAYEDTEKEDFIGSQKNVVAVKKVSADTYQVIGRSSDQEKGDSSKPQETAVPDDVDETDVVETVEPVTKPSPPEHIPLRTPCVIPENSPKDPYSRDPRDMPPMLGKNLTKKQQDVLDAINDLEEMGKRIDMQSIMKNMGAPEDQQAPINGRIIALEKRGLVVRKKVGRKFEIETADPSGWRKITKTPPVNLFSIKKSPLAATTKTMTKTDGRDIPYAPEGAEKHIILKICQSYIAEKLVYSPDNLPRIMMMRREDVINGLHALEINGYIRFRGDKIIPLKNINGNPIAHNIMV